MVQVGLPGLEGPQPAAAQRAAKSLVKQQELQHRRSSTSMIEEVAAAAAKFKSCAAILEVPELLAGAGRVTYVLKGLGGSADIGGLQADLTAQMVRELLHDSLGAAWEALEAFACRQLQPGCPVPCGQQLW